MLGLIDSREEPPAGGETHEPWYVAAVSRLFPWPAIIAWMLVAGAVLDGWWSTGATWVGFTLLAWRALRLLPTDSGMQDYHQ
jgi:hypothetical protein